MLRWKNCIPARKDWWGCSSILQHLRCSQRIVVQERGETECRGAGESRSWG